MQTDDERFQTDSDRSRDFNSRFCESHVRRRPSSPRKQMKSAFRRIRSLILDRPRDSNSRFCRRAGFWVPVVGGKLTGNVRPVQEMTQAWPLPRLSVSAAACVCQGRLQRVTCPPPLMPAKKKTVLNRKGCEPGVQGAPQPRQGGASRARHTRLEGLQAKRRCVALPSPMSRLRDLRDSNPGRAPLSVQGPKKISILDVNSSLYVSDFQHMGRILKQF